MARQSRHHRWWKFGPLTHHSYRSPSRCHPSRQKSLHANSRSSITNTT
jgi:hypothetical protein